MKRMTLLFAIVTTTCHTQTFTTNFDTFTLQPGSFYKDTNSAPFTAAHAIFSHQWTNGSFPYWSGGFAYTNDYDSSTAGFSNLYGVIPYKGSNGSDVYVVGQDKAVIRLQTPGGLISGFNITNTTYAYKSMKNGDSFAKKFGGTTGTDPDFFKLVIRGYRNGVLKTDSVEFYLADFRSAVSTQDYIVNSWQFVNIAVLGEVDSLSFFMRSSDVGQFGINTPLYFGLDDFTVTYSNLTGVEELAAEDILVYPNPFNEQLTITTATGSKLTISDNSGKIVIQATNGGNISTAGLPQGVYYLRINEGGRIVSRQLIKN